MDEEELQKAIAEKIKEAFAIKDTKFETRNLYDVFYAADPEPQTEPDMYEDDFVHEPINALPSDVGMPYGQGGGHAITGMTIGGGYGLSKIVSKPVDPNKLPKYSSEDVDKLIMMLTLWMEDDTTRKKLEEMYKYWKETQK